MVWSRAAAVVLTFVVVGAACTSSSTYVSRVSPETSPSSSPSPSAEASPSPSTSPTATAALAITNVPVHDGELGQAFAPITLSATGGIGPYSWAIGTGALPSGLLLSAQGTISGSVTKAGAFKFTVAVADSGGHQATKATAITVAKALAVKGTCSTKCVIGAGCTKCGTFGTLSGGVAPFVVSPTGGAVPPGMTLSGLSLLGGFPAGTYQLTVQITDKLGVKVNVQAFWSIYTAATLKSGGDCISDPSSVNPPSCSLRWTYAGGTPGVAPKVVVLGFAQNCNVAGQCSTPTALPPVWKVTAQAGVVTIQVSTIPCTSLTTSYLGTIRLALADTWKCPTPALSNEVDLAVDLSYSC